MKSFESEPKIENKESEIATYVAIDVNSSKLIGMFEDWEEVRDSSHIHIGDLIYKIDSADDLQTIKKMAEESEGGVKIRKYLDEKGCQHSTVPSREHR